MRKLIGTAAALATGAAALVATQTVPAYAATPTCQGKPATIVGTARADRLTGTPGADVLVGLGGNDTLIGLGGNDLLCGGGGADDLFGGSGADRIVGGANQRGSDRGGSYEYGDRIDGGPGDDWMSPGRIGDVDTVYRPETIAFAESAQGVTVDLTAGTATGAGTDRFVLHPASSGNAVHGSAHADVITGTDGTDEIHGGHGNDRIDARGGDDWVHPGPVGRAADDDIVHLGAGEDRASTAHGRDEIHGGGGRDFINVHAPAQATVLGDEGDDYLDGEIGDRGAALANAAFDGGPGRDNLILRMSRKTAALPSVPVTVDARNRRVTATHDGTTRTAAIAGFEHYTQLAEQRLWTFVGSDRPERYDVLGGQVRAFGRGGDDTLRGGWMSDLLDGGAGADTLHGSEGRDTCRNGERVSSCER